MKIVFLGTPEFGAIILEKLCQQGQAEYQPVLVVAAPDKPVGRKQVLAPPPIKPVAEKFNIPIFQPEEIKNQIYPYGKQAAKIKNLNPDLIIVAAYGQIIPKEILAIPKHGCLNVHPSLLPKYRGPSPIQYTILNNEKETGVTIILMNEKVDQGPIIAKSKIKNQISKITYGELLKELANLGAELLIKTIPKWIKGEIKPKPQDDSQASYTKILKKEDGQINWSKSADYLERQIRAFEPWPGSFTFWEKNRKSLRIKILKARILKAPNHQSYPLGKTLVAPQNELCVQSAEGFLIVEKLQLEGKKPTTSEEFLRGHPDFIGTILK